MKRTDRYVVAGYRGTYGIPVTRRVFVDDEGHEYIRKGGQYIEMPSRLKGKSIREARR